MAKLTDNIPYFEQEQKKWASLENIDFYYVPRPNSNDPQREEAHEFIKEAVSITLNKYNLDMKKNTKFDVFFDAVSVGSVFSINHLDGKKDNYYYANNCGRDIEAQEHLHSFTFIAVIPKDSPMDYFLAPIIYPSKENYDEFYFIEVTDGAVGINARPDDSAETLIDRYFYKCDIQHGILNPNNSHDYAWRGKKQIDKLIAHLKRIDFPGQLSIVENFANHLEISANKWALELELINQSDKGLTNKI